MVRKIGVKPQSEFDEVFCPKVALKFTQISKHDQKAIKEYVDIFASNIIYLQILIDTLNADEMNLKSKNTLSDSRL